MFRSSLRSFFETLAEAAPPGYTAAHKYPADDVSLLHEQVNRFPLEVECLRWECGRVIKRLSEGRKRTKGCSQATFIIPEAKHEFKFPLNSTRGKSSLTTRQPRPAHVSGS